MEFRSVGIGGVRGQGSLKPGAKPGSDSTGNSDEGRKSDPSQPKGSPPTGRSMPLDVLPQPGQPRRGCCIKTTIALEREPLQLLLRLKARPHDSLQRGDGSVGRPLDWSRLSG
ncbi:hypothetical protein RRG08_035812 [Elysia crispata]|uniref:Uncharacterized protein n=1 Tax=Elysia crispata TaxID=231223 RepID=A0AAE1AJ80_9GAST|nr:hypothetical protein RRG08_035812 [Elysia crispata]